MVVRSILCIIICIACHFIKDTWSATVCLFQVAQVASKELGVPLERISIKPNDTVLSPNGIWTGGSTTSELNCLVSGSMLARNTLLQDEKHNYNGINHSFNMHVCMGICEVVVYIVDQAYILHVMYITCMWSAFCYKYIYVYVGGMGQYIRQCLYIAFIYSIHI